MGEVRIFSKLIFFPSHFNLKGFFFFFLIVDFISSVTSTCGDTLKKKKRKQLKKSRSWRIFSSFECQAFVYTPPSTKVLETEKKKTKQTRNVCMLCVLFKLKLNEKPETKSWIFQSYCHWLSLKLDLCRNWCFNGVSYMSIW